MLKKFRRKVFPPKKRPVDVNFRFPEEMTVEEQSSQPSCKPGKENATTNVLLAVRQQAKETKS